MALPANSFHYFFMSHKEHPVRIPMEPGGGRMSDSPEPEPKRYRVYSPSSPPHPHHQRSPTASTQLSPQSRPVSQPSLPVSQLVESIGDNRREISPAPSQRKNTDSNSNASAAEPLAYPRPSLPKGLSAVHSLDTGGTTARGPNTFKHAYSYPPSSSRSPAQHEHGHAAGPSRPSYDSYEPRRNPYEPTAYSGRYDDGYARRNPAHPTPPDSAGLRRPPPSPLSLARPSSSHQEFPSLSPLDVASTRQPNHPWPHGERRGSYTGGSSAEVASASRQYIRSPVSVSPRENGDFPRPSQTPTWDIANRSRPHSQHGYSASNRLSNNRYDPVASPLYARQPLHNAGPFPDYPRDYARQGRPDVNRVDIPRAQEHVAPTIPTPKTLKRRRASFSTLLPFSQSGVGGSSRSFPGEWTPEKREIFMDRIITAGYKALDLGALATELELKKKQLINQLTPGRKGSIRERCMKAALSERGDKASREMVVRARLRDNRSGGAYSADPSTIAEEDEIDSDDDLELDEEFEDSPDGERESSVK